MDHSQKMVLTNFESEIANPIPSLPIATDPSTQLSSEKKAKSQSHPLLDKLTRQIKIILKLAKIGAYDTDLRIRGEGDEFINNSNIINLLADATATSKVLIGYNEFIKLLYEANVEPELIINENVKYQLIRMYKEYPRRRVRQLYTRTAPAQLRKDNEREPIIRTNIKRARSPDIDEEGQETLEPPQKKLNWILPEDQPLPEDDNEW
jgi:hypothetical protein